MFPVVGAGIQADRLASPLLGSNLSLGGEGWLPLPVRTLRGRKGGKEAPRWWGGDPTYLEREQSCPAHFPSEWGGWGGVGREETDWTDTSPLHHLHLLFPSAVCVLSNVRVARHVCVVEHILRRRSLWFWGDVALTHHVSGEEPP